MDLCMSGSTTPNEQIREIEDIIDIQKANGNFTAGRQVVFNIPSDSDTITASLVKSLESGLSKTKCHNIEKKKIKKSRVKRHKSPPDVVSWPSDSDITVLRMKLCLTNNEMKEKVANVIPGDGLHQPDSSSMVNLVTMMRQSQPPSKHRIIEEYLLPLTSWERGLDQEVDSKPIIEEGMVKDTIANFTEKLNEINPMCSQLIHSDSVYQNCEVYYEESTMSKIARFLRLYFCPCCRCLYKMENMSEDPSAYWENRG